MLEPILTLGPATSDEDKIKALLEAAGRFRLNTSHINTEELNIWLGKLENIFTRTGKKCGVVIDLQGSKMRIGEIKNVSELPEKVIFSYGSFPSNENTIPVPHIEFFSSVRAGDSISLNDDRIHIEITDVKKNFISGAVLKNGPLSSNKGINRSNHPIPFESLTDRDIQMIKTGMSYDFTQFAFSFILNGSEAEKLRVFTENRRLIAKIERPEAMVNLDFIDKEFDELWFCRGDLGAQAGIYALGRLQEEFSSEIKKFKSPCILAGQVLEHMTHFPEPTRTEVVHLYDIEKRGYRGFVLSDETAVGRYPEKIAEFLLGLKKAD